jgi:hypothetical protein
MWREDTGGWGFEREMSVRLVEIVDYWGQMNFGALAGPKAARRVKPAPHIYKRPLQEGAQTKQITKDPEQIRAFFDRLRG